MKKTCIWFYMLAKRLFRKYSFLIILLLIPLTVPLANVAMQSESGVLRIGVCNAGTDANAEKIMEELLSSKSILLYKKYETPEEARRAVETGEADGAWIFAADFSRKAEIHVKEKKTATMVTVLERESTVPLQLAREKLYGAVYPYVSRLVYTMFLEQKFTSPFSEEEMQRYYNESVGGEDIVRMEKLYKTEAKSEENYLTAPLRGLMAMVVVLCGLAAACYFLGDAKAGKYDWLSARKRILPALGTCFAAVLVSGIAVFSALHMARLGVGITRELSAMLLFILATTGFCTCIATLFRDAGHLGACIPFFIIGMLALSPVFFDVQSLRTVGALLPTWHYLHAIHDSTHLTGMLFYCIGMFGVTSAVHFILHRKK